METFFSLEKRAIHLLLINSYNLPNLGLLSGKMGIALFFIHYSVKTKQPIFKDYAFDIIDKITNEINQYTTYGLDSGLAGIGWGVEYLLKNEYAKGIGVEICNEIDKKIMQTDPRRINDLSLETGLEGLLHYILLHTQEAIIKKTPLPFDHAYFEDIYTTVCSIPLYKQKLNFRILINTYTNFYKNKQDIHYIANLFTFIKNIKVDGNNIQDLPLGLKDGLAGYMLNSLIIP